MTDAPVWRRCYAYSVQHGYLCTITGPDYGDCNGGWEWMIRRIESPEYIADHGETRSSSQAMMAADHAAREAAEARAEVADRNQDLYTASEDEM